jgi:hypothetical protein
MANIQAFVTIGVLVTLSSEAAIAMSPQEIPAEVKSCKAITDDKERLRCFDGSFAVPQTPIGPHGSRRRCPDHARLQIQTQNN